MPFKDPEQRRRYQRDWARLNRARRTCRTLSNPGTVTPLLRIRTAQDVLRVLERALAEVQGLQGLTPGETLQKARTLATVALTVLKALEVASLEARIEELERLVNGEGERTC